MYELIKFLNMNNKIVSKRELTIKYMVFFERSISKKFCTPKTLSVKIKLTKPPSVLARAKPLAPMGVINARAKIIYVPREKVAIFAAFICISFA